MSNFFTNINEDSSSQIDVEQTIKKPNMYKVIMHNDDYTTMDFVVEVLTKIFHKNPLEANNIMLNIHTKGKGLCGVFTFDIALTKIDQVHTMAQTSDFPLKCTYEKA